MAPSPAIDTAILLLRVVLGLTMAAHGYNKFFGGGRIPGTAGWFDSIGMKPGMLHARIAAIIASGLVAAVAIAGTGAGRYSLDHLLFANCDFYHLLYGWCGLAIAMTMANSSSPFTAR